MRPNGWTPLIGATDRLARAVRSGLRSRLPAGLRPDAGLIRGPGPAWDFYVEVMEAFEGFVTADAELVDAGDDKVVVHARQDLRGKTSGAGVEFDYWVVATFRDGKRDRDERFADRAEALEAAGLSE